MKPVLYFLSVLLIALSSSCKKTQSNVLVVHLMSEPEDMHPTNGASAVRAEINLYTNLSLLRVNYKTGELLPCLVKALPVVSLDGLNYNYELKNNMTWDDGTPITARDILFTAKASKCLYTNNPGFKPYWENILDIEEDPNDIRKFTVIMKRPYILNTWFWTDFPILQEAFYDKSKTLSKYKNAQLTDSVFLQTKPDVKKWADEFNSSKYSTDPQFMNGGGPYKITKWDKGVSITLEKKKDHWSGNCKNDWYCQANPDKIILKLNSNNASALLELKNGLIDVSTVIDYASFSELSKDENFKKNYLLKLADTYNYTYVAMNMKPDGQKHKKLFTDPDVRKAMAMLTPYEQINKTLYENHNKRVIGPISPNKPDFNTALSPIAFDVEAAKDILDEAGWTDTDNDNIRDKMVDGEKVKMEFNINFIKGSKVWEDLGKQLSESMGKAGIYAMLNPLDYNGFFGAATGHDFDMIIGAWQSSAPPEDFSQLWHSSSWTNHGLNFTGFGTPQSDALIDSINTCINEPKRIELSKRFQQLVYDEQPYIFMFTQTRRVIVSKKWDNLEIYTEYPGVLLNTLKLKD
ncbi:MAG: extracellular solute-binding protein [Bacteroidetes bacterium]|jgi:peptide/nickel transport system substrate-binding protein|nr:extracellular solute-binding protein [Bacteroidota bacterium]MDF2452908.1 extracellular solute-binding protein [Bacteroidota bacterium]